LKPEFKTLGLFDKDTDGWTYSTANETDLSFMSEFKLPEVSPLTPNSVEVSRLLADRKIKMEMTNMISSVLAAPIPPVHPPLAPPKFAHRSDEIPKSFSPAKQERYSKKKDKEKVIYKEKEKKPVAEKVLKKEEHEVKQEVKKSSGSNFSNLSVVEASPLDPSLDSGLAGGEPDDTTNDSLW